MGRNNKLRREQKKRAKAKKKNAVDVVTTTLRRNRNTYRDEWNVTSSFFHEQGHYDWMASQIPEHLRVLEVGCGVGHSTLALSRRGHKIVSFDENRSCVLATEELLRSEGVNVAVVNRESVTTQKSRRYSISYAELGDLLEHDVLLLEGDILNDSKLIQWLENGEPFDAVVCWLMGTHSARALNTCINTNKIPTPYYYRLAVQNTTYELADRILRSGGVLQIVDRGQSPDDQELIDDCINSHRDQASVTSLVVQPLTFRPYQEPDSEAATRMMITVPEENRGFDLSRMALISITSLKP